MIKQLIKELYDPQLRLPKDTAFYHQVINEIESEGISAQMYHLLNAHHLFDKSPLFFQVRLTEKYYEVLYQNIWIKSETDRLLQAFEWEGMDVIPLKGVYFSEKYFGHLGARATTDIDMLVKEKEVDFAIEVIKSKGFIGEEKAIPGHFHKSFSKQMPGDSLPLTVEIHWDIIKQSTANLSIESFWNEAVRLGNYQHIRYLSDYHTFYMMCLHAWRHNLDSMRHFIDIIQMIDVLHDRLDYNRLSEDARSDQTLKRIMRTLSVVYEEFPMLVAFKELPDAWSASRRNQKKVHPYIDFIDYQFLSYDSFLHSLKELGGWLFPKRFEMINELGVDRPYVVSLINLYKKRFAGVRKTLFS